MQKKKINEHLHDSLRKQATTIAARHDEKSMIERQDERPKQKPISSKQGKIEFHLIIHYQLKQR